MKTQKQIIDEAFKLGIEFQSVTNEERAKNKTEIDILHKLTDLEDENITTEYQEVLKDKFTSMIHFAFTNNVKVHRCRYSMNDAQSGLREMDIHIEFLEDKFVCHRCKTVYRTNDEVQECCRIWAN